MKQFIYTHNNTPITAEQFNDIVPDGWQDEVTHKGIYQFGQYKAEMIDKPTQVDKAKFEVFEYLNGFYGICPIGSHGSDPLWGGDSAFEDCYDREVVQSIYDNWDGTLDEWGKITVN